MPESNGGLIGLVDLTTRVGNSCNDDAKDSETGLDFPLLDHFLKPSIDPEWEKSESSRGSWKRD